MTLRFLLAVAFLILSVVPSAPQGEPLKSIAKRTGGAVYAHVAIDSPQLPLDEMVRSAQLIVRGRIIDAVARLNDDETLVYTAYTVQPLEVLKSSPELVTTPRIGRTAPIVLRRLGGIVKVDGLVLGTTTDAEDRDNPITVGGEYFLFLSAAEDTPSLRARPGVYEALTGEYSIFPVRGGKVENFTKHAKGVRPLSDDDPRAFVATIRALLKASR